MRDYPNNDAIIVLDDAGVSSWKHVLARMISTVNTILTKKSPIGRTTQGDAFGYRKSNQSVKTYDATNFVFDIFDEFLPQDMDEGYSLDELRSKLGGLTDLEEYVLDRLQAACL